MQDTHEMPGHTRMAIAMGALAFLALALLGLFMDHPLRGYVFVGGATGLAAILFAARERWAVAMILAAVSMAANLLLVALAI